MGARRAMPAAMLLTQTSQYAVRATIHLAQHAASGPERVSEIAEALGIPRNYLSKILHQLARAGVLESERGPKGGFRLAHDAARLSLARVVEPMDPGFGNQRCLLGRAECSDGAACPLHTRWKGLAEEIRVFLENTTLADLIPS